jgi:Tol biopolymer transport system component
MRPNALLLLLCLVVCGCDGAEERQRSGQMLMILGANYDEGAGPLAVVRPDGSGYRRLTRMSAIEARWSPNGRRIAFTAATNASPQGSVWVMNADGRGQLQLVPDAMGYSRVLEWSPDGRRILYGLASDLWLMEADGSDRRRLARDVHATAADWSPDGRWIAFENFQDQDIYVMPADGGDASRVAEHGASPKWTADGENIVFLRTLQRGSGVYSVAAAGGEPRRLAPLAVEDSAYLADISPDRRWLLVGNAPGLTAVSLEDGTLRRLTRDDRDYGGDWSHDGRRIAFVRGPNLWLMDADGGKARLVRKAPGFNVFSWAWW